MNPSAISRRDPQDVPYGWITDIPPNLTIHKERAVRMYLLDPGDLDDVPFEDGYIEYSQRYFNGYKERDVEWRAWEIHGGPIDYWKFLKRHLRTHKSLQCTLLPYDYRRGGRYDVSLPAPPALQDRYVCDSPALRDIKATLEPWIWNTCNEVLDGAFLNGLFPISPRDLTADRVNAMKCAVSFVGTHRRLYAARPDKTLGSSPSMTALRKVLGQAPIAPRLGSSEWGSAVQGLEFIHTETRNYYAWDAEYLQRVFTAACGVVEKHGCSLEGWATARWEVYDKYSQSLGLGLRYDRKEKAWFDYGVGWLDGKLSSKEMRSHIRSKCTAGIAFNKLLPEAPSSSSAQRSSVQAGPSASRAPAPSTARSSA